MLFINFLCLLYLMVLADSHTISKSIDNDEKVNDNIFESIHDVDRPTIPKTRKDRQHKYKVYFSKDDDVVLQGVKETKPYSEVDKVTEKIPLQATPKPTEHAKRHKSPKRRVGSFWKKLRGKDKKKDTNKHDSKDRKRRISNHKKEAHKINYFTTKPGLGRTKAKKKHRKKLFLRQPDHKVSKRDASGLFSTRPYSNTPQSYKLQMGIAPQVDNMLKSKHIFNQVIQPHDVAMTTPEPVESTENLQAQLHNIHSKLSKLKEKYGLVGNKVGSASENKADVNNNLSVVSPEETIVTESNYQGTAHIDDMLSVMKAKMVNMMSFSMLPVTELVSSSVTEVFYDSNQYSTNSALNTVVSDNEMTNEEKTTVAITNSYALDPKDSTIVINTESHNLAARSIKEDAMTIAMNVEDLLQKELKNLYNKVKHKVSNDFRKELHTAKSTVKESYEKVSSKLCNKCKSSNMSSSCGPATTSPPTTHKPCPCKPVPPKMKDKPAASHSSIPSHTPPTKSTTAPRVKKKDEKEEDRVEDNYTPEVYAKQTYDDYVMLTLYEQMLAKTHEDNVRKLLATPDFPIYAKNKREARRLSKRNPETLTDVKLTEVVRNMYDDGGNMPDYDYIDPSANVSSTGASSANNNNNNNNYNDVDYVIEDSSNSVDYNSQDSKPIENKPRAQGPSPGSMGDIDNSATVSYNTATGSPASETSYEGLSNKISYNQFVNGYKHYLKFQQDLKNQNFSNLIKYQAHRHHSVDDIGKYILNKIPPLPTYNRRKRDLGFSDDSDNNMDYQEITTKSDDSWFRKHFYLFIDNGPPKKYHTSETVELKPGSVDLTLFLTDTTPTTRQKEEVLIRIDSKNIARKTKDTQDISLDDLSKILDSIKDKGNNYSLLKADQKSQKDEDTFMSIDSYNSTDDETMRDSSFIGKFLSGKRRHASKKSSVTTEYFPTSNYKCLFNPQGRLKRSVTKENLENTLMADFMNKDIVEEKAATTGTKEVYADPAQTSNRETNKYGYVDIDLVPRQTAVVKLHDNTKKSRIKSFFKKFHFKKNKTKKPKPKRAVHYNYYLPNPRKERFNPLKKLKDIFKCKDTAKDKDDVPPSPYHNSDYDMVSAHLDEYKPKFGKTVMSIAELQRQIPNISDTYFEPIASKHSTNKESYYKLDDKDRDLLYNYHPLSLTPTTKQKLEPSSTKTDKQITEPVAKTKQIAITQVSTRVTSPTLTKTSELLRVPPCNVMTVNLKTLEPSSSTSTSPTTETVSLMAIDDMRVVLDKMQKELIKSSDDYPIITTMYDPSSFDIQTEKYDYKKDVPYSERYPEELSIRSKLTRIAKFPIRERRYKTRKGANFSEPEDTKGDISSFDGPSVFQYLHDLGGRNVASAEKRKAVLNTTTKLKDKNVYADYFNDLLMWHNDILNLDRVPNPLWVNILKTLQADTTISYTTPDMKSLMIDLNEMNDFLGDTLNKSAGTVTSNASMEGKSKGLGVRALENELDEDEGLIRSVAMDDKTLVTSKDMIIRGEAKYFQYNKPKYPLRLGSSNFVRKLNILSGNDDKLEDKVQVKRKGHHIHSPTPTEKPVEPAFLVDTTLMAYDDDVDSITKEMELKKLSRNSDQPGKVTQVKMDHTPFLKTNKAPIQYYTTPLPMKPQDFHRFLNDNQMGVNFVTAPILELPTLMDGWTKNKIENKWSNQNDIVIDPVAKTDNLNTETTATRPETIQATTTGIKLSHLSTDIEEESPLKLDSTTRLPVQSVRFTTGQPREKTKIAVSTNVTNKNSYWGEDFDRYKRYSPLKLTSNSAIIKSKVTPEPKYYDMFKKKMKDKLFDKKPMQQPNVENPTSEALTVDPHNKEVEITIINFDDLDKVTTSSAYTDTFTLPKKEEVRTFTDFDDIATSDTPTTHRSTTKTTQKDEIHNELLYKDIFNERTTSTAITRQNLNTDVTKRTEYIDPIKDDLTLTTNKLRYPFEKVPVYPNNYNKMPPQPHGKGFKNIPKRVHITSHHYKYDIFYDDIKKSGRNHGFEGLRPKVISVTPIGMKLSRRRAPTSEEGTNAEAIQIIDRTRRNRPRRRVWRTDGPHKKRKHFTFRGSRSKSTTGMTEPSAYFEESTPPTSPENAADVTKLEEPFTASVENTGTISLARYKEPMADIEDVVTLLDTQDLGVTKSDIAAAVTLSAIKSEFFTIITVRDSVRRATAKTKAIAAHPTKLARGTKPTPATTTASTLVTTAAAKSGTATNSTKSAQPSSLVYNLKRLKTTSSSPNKSSKEKDKDQSGPQRDRQRRLFRFSLLQNRLKSFMKNLTMTTKGVNVSSTPATVTTALKSKSKRTCIKFIPDPTNATEPAAEVTKSNKHAIVETTEEISDEREGFCVTHRCDQPGTFAPQPPKHGSTTHLQVPAPVTSMIPACETEDNPPAHHDDHANHESATPTRKHHHHTTHRPKVCAVHKKLMPKAPQETFYVEPQTYDDQAYYEDSGLKCLPTTPPPGEEEDEEPATHCDCKRELKPNTFTAKDVAALEVIVDLMKNTLNYEDNSIASGFHHSMLQPHATRPICPNSSTNAIQVHIAIPYDFPNGKKRSPSVPGPVRVRKVFSAKMSTPVDLEYQVHSIEGTIASTSSSPVLMTTEITNTGGLTPGMYLLVDKPRDGFALKPVLSRLNFSDLKSRQLSSATTASITELKPTDSRVETTSMKSFAKVTLSKDFVAAINQHLIELYENRSRFNKDVDSNNNVRAARSIWRSRKLKEKKEKRNKRTEKYVVKRRIDWDAVKKYFGHDRVCNCKCKSNTTMCRACAASDAVIDELIFEFDNIGHYMADHCTEIQTFFWMNPTGGQKLRDSVNKIDRSLSDYYKRVKGKCQGRLCKTFSNYIDKRNFVKTAKTKKLDNIPSLINDLAILADDLNMTLALNVCYKDKLKENGEKFISQMNNCINYKSYNKRSNPTTTTKTMVKQVYSLDNINVNIICNPESPSTGNEQPVMVTGFTPEFSSPGVNDLDYDLEENEQDKRLGLINLFPRKNKKSKLLSYFDFNKKPKLNFKRQVDNEAPTPLISDGGGAFWNDYLKSGTNEPRLARGSNKDIPTITVDVVQRAVTGGNVLKVTATANDDDLGINTIHMTVRTSPERNPRDIDTTTDSLSRNINQMLQLFGSLQDVEAMSNSSNSNITTNLQRDSAVHKAISQDKPKKMSLVDKVKQKVTKALSTHKTKKKKIQKVKTELEKKMDELSTIQHAIDNASKHTAITSALSSVSSDSIVVVSSTAMNEETTTAQIRNKSSFITTLATKSTATNNTAESTTTLKSITPSQMKSESTPIVNETTAKFGFKNIIQAATVMFRKPPTTQCPKETTGQLTATELITELTPTQSEFADVVTSVPDSDFVFDENTTQNPTILIINDYGSQISNYSMNDDMKEGYKNLLLSIIQFETKQLNEEWDRIAYGQDKHRDDTDMRRSVPKTPKVETKAPSTTTRSTATIEASESDFEFELEQVKTTTKKKAPESLLNKIANKIGIKVINKKKVVKKPSIREARKNRKRADFIRNRKLRINTYRQDLPAPVYNKEACYSRRTTEPAQICDIQATFKHIQNLQTSLPPKTFENLMKNVSCYKYRNADATFKIPYKKKGRTWDWIRHKRSLKHFHNKIKDDRYTDDETFVLDFGSDSGDTFERFVKGDNGIYKIVKRKKRKINLEALERGLRNIPTLTPAEDELYVLAGDSVTLDCGVNAPVKTCDGKFNWKTDRKRMLGLNNVAVDGLNVVIHNVAPKNTGTYTCNLDHTVRKKVKLHVLAVPSFDVVFLPVYKTQDNCSYDDLLAIQRLGSLMANETHCGKTCSIRIDEPICQRDRSTNNTLVRATAVISMTPRAVNCSLQCKRDIVSSLVMMCAGNAAILSSIPVEVRKDGVSETMIPWKELVRPVVTHTLRKKDTNGHHEYHQLSSLMTPGKVDVVLICPGGYFLLSKYKLCSTCPPNTSARAGDNICRNCPRGTRADPGASKCHLVKTLHRRYDDTNLRLPLQWWWYPPCGYVVACCGVLFGCTACVLLSVIVHVVSRDTELRENDEDDEQKIPKPMPCVEVAYTHFPGARPLSPSRVILPRFFRPSLTSSRATDSQETKFELWKERNRPPPLPPIDFDP